VNCIIPRLGVKFVGESLDFRQCRSRSNCRGSKNDQITVADSTARDIGEVDLLTGGGQDKFILDDKKIRMARTMLAMAIMITP
jgi:hypothetical protein